MGRLPSWKQKRNNAWKGDSKCNIATRKHNIQNQVFGVGLTRSTRAIDKDDFSVMGNICIDYAIVGCMLPIIEALNGHSHLSLQDLDIVISLHLK